MDGEFEIMRYKRSDISDAIVCKAYVAKNNHDHHSFADEELQRMFPEYPIKVIYAAMERADMNGLIEYGVSLRSGWLTDVGHRMLEDLK